MAPCKEWFAGLSRYSNQGDERALDIVHALCNHRHADIRAEATAVLTLLVEFGDARAVAVTWGRIP